MQVKCGRAAERWLRPETSSSESRSALPFLCLGKLIFNITESLMDDRIALMQQAGLRRGQKAADRRPCNRQHAVQAIFPGFLLAPPWIDGLSTSLIPR